MIHYCNNNSQDIKYAVCVKHILWDNPLFTIHVVVADFISGITNVNTFVIPEIKSVIPEIKQQTQIAKKRVYVFLLSYLNIVTRILKRLTLVTYILINNLNSIILLFHVLFKIAKQRHVASKINVI